MDYIDFYNYSSNMKRSITIEKDFKFIPKENQYDLNKLYPATETCEAIETRFKILWIFFI
jgi:uncharacterized protein YjaG (DUF416 family)